MLTEHESVTNVTTQFYHPSLIIKYSSKHTKSMPKLHAIRDLIKRLQIIYKECKVTAYKYILKELKKYKLKYG